MDQLFDRFGDLLKSWVGPNDSEPSSFFGKGAPSGASRSGDPFLDEAMAELDAFLDDDKDAQERMRRESEARARAGEGPRAGASRPASGPPPRLLAAYKVLGVPYGAPFEETKAAYKGLLKRHHPDKHGSDPESQRRATETCARINDAFRIVETWRDTGTLGDE
ncbi:MAG: DnaJ domain-containing protein [Spirochaetes bacterium]|nr:DnaJ domain-containing protein [Spirochaetota bacterium]